MSLVPLRRSLRCAVGALLVSSLLIGGALCLSGCGTPGGGCEEWTYQTRPGEEGSRLYVCAVEDYVADGKIYHVYVDGLQLPNPDPSGVQPDTLRVIEHLALTEKAFRASVVKQVRTDAPLPAFQEGYERWRKAFRKNEAAAFDVPVRDCVQQVADSMR